MAGEAGQKAVGFVQRGMEAETREQWEVAAAGYDAALEADAEFGAAYERLAEVYLRQGRQRDAVATLLEMMARIPPTCHSYRLLSHAYLLFDQKGPGDLTGTKARRHKKRGGAGAFGMPRSEKEAGTLACRAAQAAVQADPDAAEAQLASGFALIAADLAGTRMREALAAFGRAVLLDPRNADAQYALGYGIRVEAATESEEGERKADLERAVRALKAALDLRPDYYDAHRELAYCYHLLDDTTAARREYGRANANRGGATDEKEVAVLNLALADLYRRAAAAADDRLKQECLAAAAGYVADAREITPDLQGALDSLTAAGLKSHLTLSPLATGAEDRAQEPARRVDPPPARKDANPESLPAPGPAAAAGDVNQFDLSGFPREPTNFEEQQVLEAIRSATTPALKADAHARLARYYAKRSDAARARAERAKADYWRGGGHS